MRNPCIALGVAATLAACSSPGSNDPFAGFGPNPKLPAPHTSFFPTVDVRSVVGWSGAQAPTPAAGFKVQRFVGDLDHPRWLLVLPNGDVLIAEAATLPEKPNGIRTVVENMLMKKAGGQKEVSPDTIILARDTNGDGVADFKSVFAKGIRRPFGMALVGNTLYVALDNGVIRYPYEPGQTEVRGPGERVFDLPSGRNHHWTKTIIASPDGTKLYETVGSNSNVGENGMEEEVGRAAIYEYDIATGKLRIFATGLRNPNGMGWEPTTGVLWAVANERDELGNDLVPDYMTSVREGGFYGWPYSYYGQNVDNRIKPQRPDLVAKAIKPDFALGPHTGSLGLTFYTADLFPPAYKGGVFIGQHGSWNRKPLNGYRVVFVPFAGGQPQMSPQVFLSGFVGPDGKVRGRPVGVTVDGKGALLVADDVGNVVWRVTPAA